MKNKKMLMRRRIFLKIIVIGFIFLLTNCEKNEDLLSGNRITFLGNSITYGHSASDQGHRFTSLIAANKSWQEINLGVPSRGMTVCGKTPPSPWIDIMETETPIKKSEDRYIVYMFGLNDAFYYAGVEQFTTDYKVSINKALSNGWEISNIVLSTMPYTTYPVLSLECPKYNTAIKEIGVSFKIKVVDTWQNMANNGGVTLLSGDKLHPTDAGHAVIANGFIKELN